MQFARFRKELQAMSLKTKLKRKRVKGRRIRYQIVTTLTTHRIVSSFCRELRNICSHTP